MAETGDKPYRAEYAKSGRASCKKCGESIAKDSLRLALMVQVRRGPALGCAAGGPAVVVPRAESGGPGARPHSAEGRPHPARGAAGSAASTPRGAPDGGEESGGERSGAAPHVAPLPPPFVCGMRRRAPPPRCRARAGSSGYAQNALGRKGC